jgi:hypothetical protein
MIALIAEYVEIGTGRSWLDDPFTGLALRSAMEAFVFRCTPFSDDDPIDVPPSVDELAGKMLGGFGEQLRTPAGYGSMQAQFAIHMIENATPLESVAPSEFGPEHQTVLRDIARDLGLGAKKAKEK